MKRFFHRCFLLLPTVGAPLAGVSGANLNTAVSLEFFFPHPLCRLGLQREQCLVATVAQTWMFVASCVTARWHRLLLPTLCFFE